jgi:hypothetical protein
MLHVTAPACNDVGGSLPAHCRGDPGRLERAFVVRPAQVLDALAPKPAFVAPDLVDLAGQVVERQTIARETR